MYLQIVIILDYCIKYPAKEGWIKFEKSLFHFMLYTNHIFFLRGELSHALQN